MMMPCDAYEDLDTQERQGGLELEKELVLPVTTE